MDRTFVGVEFDELSLAAGRTKGALINLIAPAWDQGDLTILEQVR